MANSLPTTTEIRRASEINGYIRRILQLFPRRSYIGYTATPYASVLTSPVSDNEDFPNYKRKNNSNITDNIFDVEEVDGYSMIINKEKFNNKFFDENFFMYLENNDLCLRCKKMGEKIFIVNNSKISHLGAKAVDSKYSHEVELSRNWHWMWSKFYFNKKYKGFFFALIFSFPNLIFTLLKFIFYFIFFKSKKNIYKMRLFGLLNSIVGKKAWYRPNIN